MGSKPSWRDSTRTVPAQDLEERTLGVGNPNSADKSAGKHNARWARVDLTGGGAGPVEFDVAHDLGKVPTLVTLGPYERASGACSITARGVRPETWSHTHVLVEVTLIAGSLDGCVASFLVQGG